jgi:photosystem II stability/assembly factor-like uncharacterized protein
MTMVRSGRWGGSPRALPRRTAGSKHLRLTILAVSLVMAASPSSAQWVSWNVLSPYPTGNTIHAAVATSTHHVVGVTKKGEAVVTTDGGTTWQLRPISDGIYRGLAFLGETLGWAVGSGARRLHETTDGGFTWTALGNAPDTTMYAVDFADSSTGWAVGYNGFIIKTTDGGRHWRSQSVSPVYPITLYGVDALDSETVFVAGDNALLLKSTDGGSSWRNAPRLFNTPTDWRCVRFISRSVGFAGGLKSRILMTTDGGERWSSVHNPGGERLLWSIAFNRGGVGLAVGSSSEVLRSTDRGNSWKRLLLPGMTTLTFYAVTFGDENTVYLAGSNGCLYKSFDAGATWQ